MRVCVCALCFTRSFHLSSCCQLPMSRPMISCICMHNVRIRFNSGWILNGAECAGKWNTCFSVRYIHDSSSYETIYRVAWQTLTNFSSCWLIFFAFVSSFISFGSVFKTVEENEPKQCCQNIDKRITCYTMSVCRCVMFVVLARALYVFGWPMLVIWTLTESQSRWLVTTMKPY